MRMLLCVVAALALSGNAPKQGGKTYEAQPQENRAANAPTAPQLPRASQGDSDAKCPQDSRPNLSCSALAAEAAIRQAVANERQVPIGIAGVIAGLVTAIIALFAARFAWQASDAAWKNLSHAETTATAELRPYVLLNSFSVDPSPISPRVYDVHFVVENFGMTPAMILKAEAGHVYAAPTGAAADAFTSMPWEQPHTKHVLGKGHTLQFSTFVSARTALGHLHHPLGQEPERKMVIVGFRLVYKGLAGPEGEFTTQQGFHLHFQDGQPTLPEYVGWNEILDVKETT